ncbi:hypothetical protein Osc7112_6424 (plasmid) [Oscillatoria nigro-viridis PCC 7112]|uniref:Uncharacterized protein n=1 Tax=Phormidium nigroviride PCC 7112 TaxID=179408 RepID=K9VSN5_9CYAN|nr:hypothetical protein Osc7112_6424 [Oscillatoria nigro-viridis PCC 7112]
MGCLVRWGGGSRPDMASWFGYAQWKIFHWASGWGGNVDDCYPSLHPPSDPPDLMDRPGKVIVEWENMNFDERIQADPSYIERVYLWV